MPEVKLVGVIVGGECAQGAGFEYAYLLLGVLQGALAEMQEFRATFVRGQKLFKGKLPGFHGGDNLLQLTESALESWIFGCFTHRPLGK